MERRDVNEVFADAFFYIALLNPKDGFNARAVQTAARLNRRVVTTSWVLTEVADAFAQPRLRSVAHDFLQMTLKNPRTDVISGESWFQAGLDLYGARPDKSWSLTDCISFAVMRQRGVSDALTGDHHFVQAGLNALFLS